jgi:succinate dehydrogenase / fumarate reductase iron-sulfur subunit
VSDLNLKLHVWRQPGTKAEGKFVPYSVTITEHASFLEMLDVLNDQLTAKGEEPMLSTAIAARASAACAV